MGLFGGDDDASKAIEKANQQYQEYVQKAMAELRTSRTQGRTDISGYAAPYVQAGQQGLQAYLGSLGLAGGDAQQSAVDRFRQGPGYQFALRQGMDAITSANAARGMTGSGAAAMALQRYGQGLASQQYGQYQSQLAGLAGMGQQTSMRTGGELAQLGLGYSGDIAGLYGQAGQAQAASTIAAARAKSAESGGVLGTIGTIGGGIVGAYFGGPVGASMGAKLGGSLGKQAGSSGKGWSAFGGQQQPAGGGFGSLSSLGGIFGQSYNPSQGTAATSLWGSNVWENPDTEQLVPIG